MYTVFANFPIAKNYEAEALKAFDDSISITRGQPGLLALQVLQSSKNKIERAAIMMWDSESSFQNFFKSEDSKKAHADVKPEFFSPAPRVETFEVLDTWHSEGGHD